MNCMSEDWEDDTPNWDDMIDVSNIHTPKDSIDIVDGMFKNVKHLTDVLTDMMVEECTAKDLTISKLQFTIDHLMRCIVSLVNESDGMLLGGCIFLPSDAIPMTEASQVISKTKHVDWGDDMERKEKAVNAFMSHMLKISKEEIANNDERMSTLSQRFRERMEEK
mgnify:CR=1 FL=1